MRRTKPQRGMTVLQGNPALAAWPVNSIFIAYTSANPSTLLGGGTWTQIAQGQMLVGQNPSDASFDVLGDTGGEKTHVLTEGELPQHYHGIGHDHGNATKSVQYAQTTSTGGTAYRVTDIGGVVGGGGSSVTLSINVPSFSGNSGMGSGGGNAHNNMPPFLTVYMWRRTA